MFWVDEIIKNAGKGPHHITDGKTPSGKIHVGSLRGVLIHDAIFRALKELGVEVTFSYLFDDFDAFDRVPAGLDENVFSKYIGIPLSKVPSPDPSKAANYGEYFANDFSNVLHSLGIKPAILWQTKLHKDGILDEAIQIVLDNAEKIQDIYQKISGSQKREQGWFPFQPICEKCGKIGTTKATAWDGKEVQYTCVPDLVTWAKGCGHHGKISPFGGNGKLPWKLYWPARWHALGTTIEGEGKDLASKGGARDVANHIAQEVYKIKPPYDVPYEFFLFGGKKMSTSKGVGTPASEIIEILPPEIVHFLMLRSRPMQAFNFDPTDPMTIPKLFDDYDKTQTKKQARFMDVVHMLQIPGKEKKLEKADIKTRVPYAKIWLERFAPEEEKFTVKEEFPEQALHLSGNQKIFLSRIADGLLREWRPEDFEEKLYEWVKEVGLASKEAFIAIYAALIGKDHGPKAAWLILSLDKKFVVNRFKDAAQVERSNEQSTISNIKILNKPEIFSIDKTLARAFPSISVGVAIIRGVAIKKSNELLEKEKQELQSLLSGLTTKQLGQYPEVISYRKLYKQMGIDWHSRRPSPEALLRRVALNKGLYSINTCVDAYNLVVMKDRVSVGSFDLDTLKLPTILRFAKEGEEILLLGDTEPTKYSAKEVAYFDENGGFNIDFNYRDSQKTAVQLDTKNLYINVDGVFDITSSQVERSLKETCDTIMKYCGGKLELFGVETASQ